MFIFRAAIFCLELIVHGEEKKTKRKTVGHPAAGLSSVGVNSRSYCHNQIDESMAKRRGRY